MWLFVKEKSYQNARQNLNFILQNQPASRQPNPTNTTLSPTKT